MAIPKSRRIDGIKNPFTVNKSMCKGPKWYMVTRLGMIKDSLKLGSIGFKWKPYLSSNPTYCASFENQVYADNPSIFRDAGGVQAVLKEAQEMLGTIPIGKPITLEFDGNELIKADCLKAHLIQPGLCYFRNVPDLPLNALSLSSKIELIKALALNLEQIKELAWMDKDWKKAYHRITQPSYRA